MEPSKISVISTYSEVLPFLESVVVAADSDKAALGFFPASVFTEYARKEQLYVAIEVNMDGCEYVGHILFDCRPPKAKILQIFCRKSHRGKGAAKLLLDQLKLDLSANGIISIYARVAEDLLESNKFWEAQGFYVRSIVPGGKSKKRTILERAHELNVPQLFDASGISKENPFGIGVFNRDEKPIFLLDLNVLFDLGPRRARNESALDIFRSERIGSCKLAVSAELEKELNRTSVDKRTDPMISFARIFPCFSFRGGDEGDVLLNSLAKIVFRDRHRNGALCANDFSDIRHLATAIQHNLSGLITSDGSILGASAELKRTYGIDVVSPSAFRETNAAYLFDSSYDIGEEGELSTSHISSESVDSVICFLKSHGISSSEIHSDWVLSEGTGRIATSIGVWGNGSLVGYMISFKNHVSSNITSRIVVDEKNVTARMASKLLIQALQDKTLTGEVGLIALEVPAQQVAVREAARSAGFFTAKNGSLTKILICSVVTKERWSEIRSALSSVAAVSLPDTCPAYRGCEQHLEVKVSGGERANIKLEMLEHLLSPVLFCFPGRGAVITPIQSRFSELLLGSSPQKNLLAGQQASLHHDRHYISDAKTCSLFGVGTIILFYESKKNNGLGAVVAIAKTKNSYLRSVELIDKSDLDPSVIGQDQLNLIGKSPVKTVTAFSNLMVLKNPVSLERLKTIGCGRPVDLITTKNISSDQLLQIVNEGFGYVKK